MKNFVFIILVMALLMAAGAQASAVEIKDLQQQWAVANYQVEEQAQDDAFNDLIVLVDDAVANNSDDVELLIWQGIIKSTYAGKVSGLSALGLVKDAKSSFEQAMKLDDMALKGSVYTSLGALYYQVPGWPIAFGNDKKARKLLEKAVSINPDGLDANYFYGDFLFQEKQFVQAKEMLQKALLAKPRLGREIADSGRRQEINALLALID